MVFITGDTHGDFKRILDFEIKYQTTNNDTIIILGDSGFNYYTDLRAKSYKNKVKNLSMNIFCIHGNHEERASNLSQYKVSTFWGGKVLVEDEFPNIKFALDGEIYTVPTQNGNKNALVIGGAYSVDKNYRLKIGANWYESEQLSQKEMNRISGIVEVKKDKIDIVLTHTCPLRYLPYEWFISGINQDTVDRTMEKYLESLYEKGLSDKAWYCGHYHGDKKVDNLRFMFNDICQL